MADGLLFEDQPLFRKVAIAAYVVRSAISAATAQIGAAEQLRRLTGLKLKHLPDEGVAEIQAEERGEQIIRRLRTLLEQVGGTE